MKQLPIIIDCDPGQDDAVALALAFAAPERFNILGVTAVAGNVPLNLTQRNARIMCELCDRTDIPVYAGCEKPLAQDLITAEYVHGNSGLDGIEIYKPDHPLQDQHGVDFIIETCLNAEEPVTIVPTGPLTNIGKAIRDEPKILSKIEQIVLMGGAQREGGNTTPAAEFNIYVDPEAADIVFRCGRPIVVMGLDVTHQVLTTPDRLQKIREIGSDAAVKIADMIAFYERYDIEKYEIEGGPLHDPCTIAYLLEPDLFQSKKVNVTVELNGKYTRGETVVDHWQISERETNVDWAYIVDADAFFKLLIRYLKRF